MSITLITCTGGRPEAFALCERWISRQTYRGDVLWVVVDDGPEPTECTGRQIVIRPHPLWQPGQVTLARNLRAALAIAPAQPVLFIEDDEHYSPEYVDTMARCLERYELVGQVPARYYHVGQRRYRELGNRAHASLCQTGIAAELIPAVASICKTEKKFIDLKLWRSYRGRPLYVQENHVVGIKGTPGRTGIGVGHRPNGNGWSDDADFRVLRSWIGADADHYLKFYERTAA